MYSGARTGLVLTDIQREQEELKKRDQETMAFEGKNVKVQRQIEAHVAFILCCQCSLLYLIFYLLSNFSSGFMHYFNFLVGPTGSFPS